MRKEKKMTQMDIVRLLGYSRPAINAIEKGNDNYVINQLLDYCQLLEADLKVGRLEGGEVLRLEGLKVGRLEGWKLEGFKVERLES